MRPVRVECGVPGLQGAADALDTLRLVRVLARAPGTPLAFHASRFGSISADPGIPEMDVWEGLEDHWY